ncbi:hypothetical protein W03_01800 [Nitrosomonas sp. PY1]|uniref:HEAT repeat domain-containing protein n=1 Tax=Nitrosomonas sp. PY1 TaxID=1803906 RepID=UPI001FC89C5B|nr:HEAT repeat domain-containing protein [Nitrosomonas sp. PY1]GKS68176.1 hypothetical protein W03_01800 [Nitrosomonas sp. PY1]
MMMKLQRKHVHLSLFMTVSLNMLGATQVAHAENNDASIHSGVAFNSLASIQIQCFPGENELPVNQVITDELTQQAASKVAEERVAALSQLAAAVPIDVAIRQEIIQKALQDADPRVRGQAVYVLAQQNCADSMLLLEQALDDSELSVRLMALDGLMDNDRSIALLKNALKDDEQAVRELAAVKLESFSQATEIVK